MNPTNKRKSYFSAPIVEADFFDLSDSSSSANHFNYSIDFAPRKTLSGKRIVSKYERYQGDLNNKIKRPVGRTGAPRINAMA